VRKKKKMFLLLLNRWCLSNPHGWLKGSSGEFILFGIKCEFRYCRSTNYFMASRQIPLYSSVFLEQNMTIAIWLEFNMCSDLVAVKRGVGDRKSIG